MHLCLESLYITRLVNSQQVIDYTYYLKFQPQFAETYFYEVFVILISRKIRMQLFVYSN